MAPVLAALPARAAARPSTVSQTCGRPRTSSSSSGRRQLLGAGAAGLALWGAGRYGASATGLESVELPSLQLSTELDGAVKELQRRNKSVVDGAELTFQVRRPIESSSGLGMVCGNWRGVAALLASRPGLRALSCCGV